MFEEVGSRIAREYPATAKEKLTEIMHTAMLLNPRTQGKNIASNVVMLPSSMLANKVSALGQSAIHLIKPDFKPNQAFFVNKESRKIAREIYNSVKEQLSGNVTGKWESAAKLGRKEREVFKQWKVGKWIDDSVQESAKNWTGKSKQIVDSVFNGKSAMENLRQFTYDLLEKGDKPFVKINFESRLASYIQAQGIKNIADVSDDAISVATTEAMKATFKDDNAITSLFQGLKGKTGMLGEVVLPFSKTPANIIARTLEYGPAGIAKALTNDLVQLKLGKMTANEVIDNLSKSAVGISAIALGMYLYRQGIITGPQDENGKKAEFEKQQGYKPYSIKIGTKYYSYDWAQPAASGLVMGSTIAKALEDEENNFFDIAIKVAAAYGDTLLSTSIFQNINDILGGYGSPTEKLIGEFAEMPLRAIPSFVGAVARAGDNTVRATYSKGELIKTLSDTAKSKIPGVAKTLPAVYDTWGKEVRRQNTSIENLLSQFVLPFSIGSGLGTKLDSEVSRLYNSTKKSEVFPNKAEYTIGDTNLDNKQRSEYQKSMGEKSYSFVENAIESDKYQKLNDDQRAEVLSNSYALAKDMARSEILPEYSLSPQYEKRLNAAKEYASSTGITVNKAVAELAIAKSFLDSTANLSSPFLTDMGNSNKRGKIANLRILGYSHSEAVEIYELLK